MGFKIDCASLIVGRKFTVFVLFYFVFEGNFQVQAPPPPPGGRWAYIWRGNLTEGILHYESGGLIHGGAYFRDFTVFHLYGVSLVFLTILHNVSNVSPLIL